MPTRSRPRTALRPWNLHRGVLACVAALVLAAPLAACAGPNAGAAGAPGALYVANSLDGTVSRLDSVTGRTLGPPLPAASFPWQITAGPAGSLLVLSVPRWRTPSVHLTHLVPAGRTWRAVGVPLGVRSYHAVLAGDGGRHAVVVYQPVPDRSEGPPRCELALVDARASSVERTHTVCAVGDTPIGLALESRPAGATVYLGLRHPAPDGAASPAGSRDRVLALDPHTGAVLAVRRATGVLLSLILAPAPGRAGTRLYALEAAAPPDTDVPTLFRGRLLGLNPDTLEIESERALGFAPDRLAVAPEGDHAYALHDRTVLRLGLAGGDEVPLAILPGRGLELAVTHARIFVSNPSGSAVWALDRRRARPLQILPVGRRPTGLFVSPAG